MKTRQLISNAFLLPPLKPEAKAARFILEAHLQTLFRAGAAIAAHFYLKRSDSQRFFVEPSMAQSIDEAIALSGPLTHNLNKRFGLHKTTILDADDPAIYQTLAALPSEVFEKTSMPFMTIATRKAGFSLESIRQNLMSSYLRIKADFRHMGAALHAFSHQKEGSSYNPYARMAIAHYLEGNKSPIALSVGNTRDHERAVKIISLAKGRSLDVWSSNKMLETPALNGLKSFFIFSHELGHAVEAHDWKASMEAMLTHRFAEYRDMEDGAGWISECFADVFSACLSAKLMGNWDVAKAIIQPFRALESNIHNTYTVVDLLTKESPDQLTRMTERDIMLFAAQATERLIVERFERGVHLDDYASARFVATSHGIPTGLRASRPELPRGRGFNLAAHRVQAMVDALVLEGLYSGASVKSEDLKYLAHHFQQLGQPSSEKEFMDIAGLAPQARMAPLLSFARPDVVDIAERMTSNLLVVDDYMEVLKTPEADPECGRSAKIGSGREETKTPAF